MTVMASEFFQLAAGISLTVELSFRNLGVICYANVRSASLRDIDHSVNVADFSVFPIRLVSNIKVK